METDKEFKLAAEKIFNNGGTRRVEYVNTDDLMRDIKALLKQDKREVAVVAIKKPGQDLKIRVEFTD